MKKIILATFTLLGVMSVNAQKSILLGTDFGYHRVNGFTDNKSNEFTFSPVIAYEVADNWFVGAKTSLSYSETSQKTVSLADNYKEKNKNYTTKIGGFVRYYKPFNDSFGIFADLGAGYQQRREDFSKRDYITGEVTTNDAARYREYGYYIDFVPALYVNFSKGFWLNISFGGVEWNDTKQNKARDYDNYTKTKDFDLTFGKAINVGVTKKFNF